MPLFFSTAYVPKPSTLIEKKALNNMWY